MGIFLKQSQMLDVSKVLVIQPITLTTLNRLRLLFAFFFFLTRLQVLCLQCGPTSPSLSMSASQSFKSSYWQIGPLPTNEVSRLPRGMIGNIILPWIDSKKTASVHPSLCTYSTLAITLSWYLPNLSYITSHVCGFKTSMSADVDCKPGKTTALGFNTGLALKWQAAHNSSVTWFFLCCHDKVEWIKIPVYEEGGTKKKPKHVVS